MQQIAMVDKKTPMLVIFTRGLLLCCAICAALFPTVMKICESSRQFSEVSKDWGAYFEAKHVMFNTEMTGLSARALMRIHLYIIPYFVAAGVMGLVCLLPNARPAIRGGHGWLMFRSLLRQSVHFPKMLQLVLPARITVGEMVGVVVFLCLNMGYCAARMDKSMLGSGKLKYLSDKDGISPLSWQACELWAKTLGILAIMNMGWYLLLPVGKRSVFLDMFGISWDSAIKYHRWIGYYTFWLAIAHSVMYPVLWYANDGHATYDPAKVLVKHNMNAWGCNGEGECTDREALMLKRNMYGIAATAVLVLMVLCSLAVVRRRFFNTFYAMHHLVLVVLLFMQLHYSGTILLILPGLTVYLIDKLLGLLACTNSVTATANTVSPDVLELIVPLTSSARYAAGQYIQVNVPAASALEWHPFSISSAPHEHGGRQLTCHIKALGDWTRKVLEAAKDGSLQVHLDGFYGHDMAAQMLNHSAVVLVCGGIGITPIMSVAVALLDNGSATTKVHVLWVVRSAEEFKIFAGKLSALLAAHPDRLAVKVWITLSGCADKKAVTTDSVVAQLNVSLSQQASSPHSKSSLLSASPPVAPNKWTLSPAAQALATALAILISISTYALAKDVDLQDYESQRVLDLVLLVISPLCVAFVSLLAMLLLHRFPTLRAFGPAPLSLSPSLSTRDLLKDNAVTTSIVLAPTSPVISSFDGIAAPVSGPQMVHGTAFGHIPTHSNTAPVVYYPFPQPFPGLAFPQALGNGVFSQPVSDLLAPPPPASLLARPSKKSTSSPPSEASQLGLLARGMIEDRIGTRPHIPGELQAIAEAEQALAGPASDLSRAERGGCIVMSGTEQAMPVDIGVMACGPAALVDIVATTCNDRCWQLLGSHGPGAERTGCNRQHFFSFSEESWVW
mmetsp:Transcript_10874/g.26075  ORF Transcript_10874/g.26075 Transcript_10874/m.26075 type:complete len:900 (-) Transcript_10874:384-3083(-)